MAIRGKSSLALFWCIANLIGLSGCRKTSDSDALSQRITWAGNHAAEYQNEQSDPGGFATIPELPDSVAVGSHRFTFFGADTVELLLHEFSRDYWALAAFQSRASAADLQRGFYTRENASFFIHGLFVGELRHMRGISMPQQFLVENLAIAGEELVLKPKIFETFPLQGRLEHSERVELKHFLGLNWQGPVFFVQYQSHADTVTAFRAFPQPDSFFSVCFRQWKGKADTLEQGRVFKFQGWNEFRRPVILWNVKSSLFGLEGGYDSGWVAEMAEKMKKMTILWPKG